MDDPQAQSPDSLMNPLDNIDTALGELTSKLLPGFAETIATSPIKDVEQAMADAICQALTERLGDAP